MHDTTPPSGDDSLRSKSFISDDEDAGLYGSARVEAQLPLLVRTDPAWVDVVLADFDAFLLDHACCERKAAALCLSYIARHADKPALVEPLIALAREELAHFQ